jgi:cyclopropane fatty-acyl-phospholipid synthase-like methyltransferase
MDSEKTREPKYQEQIILRNTKGLTSLGMTTNVVWHEDPRRLLFILARYKFVSKVVSGKQKVLEVGCGDAFGTRIVLQEVDSIRAIDVDPAFVKDVNNRMEERWHFDCEVHNILLKPVDDVFDAAYSLDVLEHISQIDEHRFMNNIAKSLEKDGILIVGMPSLQSQRYAKESKYGGHINCKSSKQLKELMLKYFHNVFIFSMNDEVVHTGFYPMAHYLFAVGVGKR